MVIARLSWSTRTIDNAYTTCSYLVYKQFKNSDYYRENGTKDTNPDAVDEADGFYKIKDTVSTITGKYGRSIDWPYGTSNGKPVYKFSDLVGSTPKSYLTVGTNRCLNSFNGPDFINNNACVFEQPEDVNTIVYVYNESLTDSDKYDLVGEPYLMANRYSLPMYLSNWCEGFAPSEYAEVYIGNRNHNPDYSENVNPNFKPQTGQQIDLSKDDLTAYTWNRDLHLTEGWHPVGDTGVVIHADHEYYMYYLLIKNRRIEKNLAFKYKDDSGEWVDFTPEDSNDNIPVKYGYNLSTYLTDIQDSETELKSEIEEKVYGKVFRGWYLDPDFKLPANNANNLSLVTVGSGEIPLYAKMVTGKYHVRVFWNVNSR